MCFAPQRRGHFFDTFSTSEPPKVVRDRQFLTLLTWKCASRHNGVHFFDISTSKSGPRMVCFVNILTWKCASRHNGVHFFDISTSKSGPRMVCFVHFPLGNVLRATTACNFSSLSLASWLRTRRFSEPTFRPSGATNHWKNTSVSRLSYLFAHLYLLSSYSFSSNLLSSNLSLLYASSLLCFSSLHIVGSLTSKLPSIIYIYIHIYYIHWLVVWNMAFIFPFSWEFHHPN